MCDGQRRTEFSVRVASRNFLTICLMKILTIATQRGLTPQAAEGRIRWVQAMRSTGSGANIRSEALHLADQALHRFAPPDF